MKILHNLIKIEMEKYENIDNANQENIMKKILHEITNDLRKTLDSGAPEKLQEQREYQAGFEQRNIIRWLPALDIIEKIWLVSQETAETFSSEYENEAKKINDKKFFALRSIHARCLLITNEIICLIKGGYADGALSRWRALHENAVIASIISENNQEIAERYILSFSFSSLKSAEQLNQYAQKTGMQSISLEDIDKMKFNCNKIIESKGKEMSNDYGWTFPINGNKKPTFEYLEKIAGMDHWRPYYRWASQHNHSAHRPSNTMLGTSETLQDILLVGSSNSGMVDPLQMTATTLNIANACFLNLENSLDHQMIINLIDIYIEELKSTAVRIEIETLKAARKKGTNL